MKINEIMIDGFGKHVNLHINFEEGVNVLSGDNESGKSTVVAFIKAALYGLSGRGATSDRKKYAPWDENARYGGWMKFEHAGNYYRVTVRFAESKRGDTIILYNDMTGRQIPIPEGRTVGELVLEMSANTYDLTVFASQLGSKPEIDNSNMDCLIEQLSNSSNKDMMQSETVISKRLKSAMDYISAPRSGKGLVDIARTRKAKIDEEIAAIEKYEDDLQQTRDLHQYKENELKQLKEAQSKNTTPYENMRVAMDIMSKHDKTRRILTSVNVLDESVYEEKKRQRRYKIPMCIFLAVLFLASVAIAACVYFNEYASKISFIANLDLYKLLLKNSTITYVVIAAIVAVVILLYLVIILSGGKEMRNLNRELEAEEENLINLLGITVSPSDDKEYIDELIKNQLVLQEEQYNRAKDFLDNLESKAREEDIYHIKVEQLTQEVSYAKAAIDSLTRQIKGLGEYESLVEQSEQLKTQIASYERKYEALQLARTILSEAFEKWQADLGPVFAKTARTILYDITDGKHENMKIDRDFEISMPDEVTGRLYPSGYFSGATVDQMYLSLRLAIVKLISPDTSAFPVILDDPFVQYDANRREKALSVLRRFADNNESQVIITTCLKEDYPTGINVISLN